MPPAARCEFTTAEEQDSQRKTVDGTPDLEELAYVFLWVCAPVAAAET